MASKNMRPNEAQFNYPFTFCWVSFRSRKSLATVQNFSALTFEMQLGSSCQLAIATVTSSKGMNLYAALALELNMIFWAISPCFLTLRSKLCSECSIITSTHTKHDLYCNTVYSIKSIKDPGSAGNWTRYPQHCRSVHGTFSQWFFILLFWMHTFIL